MEVKKRSNVQRYFFALVGAMFALFILWWIAGFPRSLSEFQFLSKLKAISLTTSPEVSLIELMPTDWETVCESHGYGGDLYLKKYNKTFPAAGQMQDGFWGVIFIRQDGSHDAISSSCGNGTYISFSTNTCLTRDKSVLHRLPKVEGSRCSNFEARQ